MAKVTGPLMSMDARGAFGGALVFSAWKGRNTARQLVVPANPQSADQEAARNAQRCAAAAMKQTNSSADIRSGETLTDKGLLQSVAPAGQAWNGYLVASMIGAGAVHYDSASAAWTALTGGEKTAWDNAAAARDVPFLAVNQTIAGGGAGTPLTPGQAYFHQQYGLYIAGVGALPTATPPTYA